MRRLLNPNSARMIILTILDSLILGSHNWSHITSSVSMITCKIILAFRRICALIIPNLFSIWYFPWSILINFIYECCWWKYIYLELNWQILSPYLIWLQNKYNTSGWKIKRKYFVEDSESWRRDWRFESNLKGIKIRDLAWKFQKERKSSY